MTSQPKLNQRQSQQPLQPARESDDDEESDVKEEEMLKMDEF